MKFVCDSCQAQYLIADEKVGARGVKVKCKKCGNVIIIRPPSGESADPGSMQERSAMALAPVDGSQASAAPVRSSSRAKMAAVALDVPASNGRTGSRARMPAVPPPAPPPDETTAPPTGGRDQAESDSTVVNMSRPSLDELGLNRTALDNNVDAFAGMAKMESVPAAPAMQEEQSTSQGTVDEWAAKQRVNDVGGPTIAAPPPADVAAAIEKHRNNASAPPSDDAPANGQPKELDQELAGAFDGLFGGPGNAQPDDRKPTKVYTADEAEGMRDGAGVSEKKGKKKQKIKEHKEEKAEKPAKSEKAPIEWYAAINDEQQGPLSLEQIETHWLKSEVHPESLVWRTGMADWIPARDVKELKYLLDLVPQKKKAAPPPAPDAAAGMLSPSASVPAPSLGLSPAGDDASEEMWRPRGMTGVYQAASAAEASVAKASSASVPPMAIPRDEEEPSWKPGAASALASLVDDELSALTARKGASGAHAPVKDKGKPEGIPKPPPADDDSVEAPLAALLSAKGEAAFPGFSTDSGVPNSRRVTQSVPFNPQPAAKMSPVILAVGGVGALGLTVLLAVGLAAAGVRAVPVFGPLFNEARTPELAQANTPPPAAAPTPATPPAAAQPGAQPAAATTPTSTTPAAQEPAKGAEPANPVEPQKTAGAKDEPKSDDRKGKSKAEKREEARREKEAREEARKIERKEKEEKERETRFAAAAAEPEEPKKEREKPKPRASDCDPILYPEGCDEKQKAAAKKAAAPASGGKETLSKADILSVVKKNKGDVTRCVGEQRKKDPSKAEGILKISWVVKNSGATANVTVESEEFASAYVGKCVARAVQGWKFDAYTGDEIKPIKFPFKLDQE